MLTFHAGMKCFVCVEPQNFRKGIDGMSAVVRLKILQDPLKGAVYLFCNRAKTAIKVLFYNGQGFWLCHHRLSSGHLKWWPKSIDDPSQALQLSAREIQVLLGNGDPTLAQFVPDWKRVE